MTITPVALVTALHKYQDAGYDITLGQVLKHLDQRGQGIACGKSWISSRKKCSKDKAKTTSKANLAKTKAKAKAAKKLKSQAKRGMTRPQIEAEEAAKKGKGKMPDQDLYKAAGLTPPKYPKGYTPPAMTKEQRAAVAKLGKDAKASNTDMSAVEVTMASNRFAFVHNKKAGHTFALGIDGKVHTGTNGQPIIDKGSPLETKPYLFEPERKPSGKQIAAERGRIADRKAREQKMKALKRKRFYTDPDTGEDFSNFNVPGAYGGAERMSLKDGRYTIPDASLMRGRPYEVEKGKLYEATADGRVLINNDNAKNWGRRKGYVLQQLTTSAGTMTRDRKFTPFEKKDSDIIPPRRAA